MNSIWTMVLKMLMSVLGPLLGIVTPEISAALKAFLLDLYQKALKTPNPYDDLFVGVLLDVLGIPRPSPA